MTEEESEYADDIFRTAITAKDDRQSIEQALDLLIDAAALLISEGAGTVTGAAARLKETVPVFKNAHIMAATGTARLN